MGKQKINQVCAIRGRDTENPVYKHYQEGFTYILNPEASSPGEGGRPGFYLGGDEIQKPLMKMIQFPMNSITTVIGEDGRGKTSIIKDVFGQINNEIVVNAENGVLIIPLFYHRWLTAGAADVEQGIKDVLAYLVKTICAACSILEESTPDLKTWAKSNEAQLALYSFIKGTNPHALVDSTNPHADRIEQKLDAAYREESFIYSASRLKLYLAREGISVHRVILIVDGIESMPDEMQNEATTHFLRLYRCLYNYPKWWKGADVYVNLVLMFRPETYSRMRDQGIFKTYEEMTQLRMNSSFNLMAYFSKMLETIGNSAKNNPEYKWDEVDRCIRSLLTRYSCKFDSMIMGLAGQNVRLALNMCKAILQSAWTVRDPFTRHQGSNLQYSFNNISVIRALTCGSNLVYRGVEDDEESYIPNVLQNSEDKDDSILRLYIMASLAPKRDNEQGITMFVKEGSLTEKREYLEHDFQDLFGNNPDGQGELRLRFHEAVSLLKIQGVLYEDNDKLSLTSKGLEIFYMLSQDSVLSEVYREARYREVTDHNSMKSSNELMNGDSRNQVLVFNELLKDLYGFLEMEQKFTDAVRERNAFEKYRSLFTSSTMTGHLLHGIRSSIEFAGKFDEVSDILNDVEQKINSLL